MYCGCGAHTVALAKTGLLKQVLAVELDPRLVLACKRNIQLNELESLASVQQGDAGQWAGKEFRRRRRQQNENIDTPQSSGHMYDILLVDPPRAGLDDQVCQMALKADTGNFQDFLYISCGHEALLRDLERLSPAYKVIECAQMDLFPRTNSIETLVHLQRLAR
jgi:tRNA/tmRNA/rRNA uracil-C5-methylase (TrmA/RlmC/RlmD family)